jgi:hypothetical protein
MNRTQKSQSKHDKEVMKIALKHKKQGFDVRADAPGFTPPKSIDGYRSDVVATKGKQTIIIEVETKDSVDSSRDRKQQQAFGRVAARRKNTTFKRKIVE